MEENKKMTMALCTGSFDKLITAGIILSGAVAEDMDVEIFVLLYGAYAFKKENGAKVGTSSEYPELNRELKSSLKTMNIPTWVEFFTTAKELGNVKFYICGTAGKIWGGEKISDFIDLADDICGIGEYVDSAQNADVHMLI